MSHHMFRYRHDHDLVIPSREPYRDRVFFVKGGRVSFWFSAAIVCGIIATSVAPTRAHAIWPDVLRPAANPCHRKCMTGGNNSNAGKIGIGPAKVAMRVQGLPNRWSRDSR
jgi:hypothetical protein